MVKPVVITLHKRLAALLGLGTAVDEREVSFLN